MATLDYLQLAIKDQKLEVREQKAGSQRVLGVGTLTSPACLRIERKGDEVYVFESGSDMKWQQVLVATMVLTAPVVGVVQEADVAVTEVVEKLEVEQNVFVVSPEGGRIILPLGASLSEAQGFFFFEKGFFTQDTEVTFSIDKELLSGLKADPGFILQAITPSITLEFPYANVNKDKLKSELRFYFLLFPLDGLSESEQDRENVFHELYLSRFMAPEGSDIAYADLSRRQYEVPTETSPADSILIADLNAYYGDYKLDTVKLIHQAIRFNVEDDKSDIGRNSTSRSDDAQIRRSKHNICSMIN